MRSAHLRATRGLSRATSREESRERVRNLDLRMQAIETYVTSSNSQLAREIEELRRLTDQERRIAMLAAEGRTNKEIAQILFLSPRTVSSHLYKIFPKLGVTTRSALHTIIRNK